MAAIGRLRYEVPCPTCGETLGAVVDVDVENMLIEAAERVSVSLGIRSLEYRGECEHVPELNARRVA